MDLVPSEEEEDDHQLIQRLAYVATGMGLFTREIWVSETDKGKAVSHSALLWQERLGTLQSPDRMA